MQYLFYLFLLRTFKVVFKYHIPRNNPPDDEKITLFVRGDYSKMMPNIKFV